MKTSKRESDVAVADEAVSEAPVDTDPFDGVDFRSIVLVGAKQHLGPFLQHKDECESAILGSDGCSCGLRAAVLELKRKEVLMTRYGIAD